MVTNFYRIANIRGNKIAYWWRIIGIALSKIFKLPFTYTKTSNEIKE